MIITIQSQNYTTTLDSAHPLLIKRTLNEPSVCELWLSLPANGSFAVPVRNQSLAVTGDDGTAYFTGYIAAAPMPEYAGLALEGPRYRHAVRAISDEVLLDQVLMTPSKGASGQSAGALMTSLVTRTGARSLVTSSLNLNLEVSHFAPDAGTPFSGCASQVAGQVRAAYRALAGQLSLTPVPGTTHPLNETDGSLTLSNLTLTASAKRALANDITVCGENEAWAYATEYFLGDGITTQFPLSADPYYIASSKAKIITELFNEAEINPAVWSANPTYFGIGAAGLTMMGGNGRDGQTPLTWIDPIEMGGTLMLEVDGLILAANSTGIVGGFFSGLLTAASCIAGFQATAQSGTGAVSLQPIVIGAAAGTSYAVNPANQYTLRVRVHCQDQERIQATYYSFGDSGGISGGGKINLAGANLLFELVEIVDGVAGMPVILYDGTIPNLPDTCSILPASSINLQGTMRSFSLTNLGSGWVVCTPSGGAPFTRRVGPSTANSECEVERTGKLAFYTGYVPPVGEQIAVTYRTQGRAVGRAVNSASQSTLAAAGLPSVSAWIGSVTNPPARSSADCRTAASVIVQASSGVSALWSGTYKGTRQSFASDVWPGDELQLNATSFSLNAQVVVRTVEITYTASSPDLVQYEITFANDWADDLAIKTSITVPAETWLPAATGYTPIANLNALAVTALSGSSVTVDTGVAPPTGGGFEVRTRDFAFMPGSDSTLVLRGSEQTLTFPRLSANDRFYIRMFDGSMPPNYSEFSTALFINLPL
ncbi:hypothetical protein [Terracidiphilus gabretensis]|uniref:hypothetical protein n=1 Tax=Terracidiphilus gabretensis TaxID=1577687 RepID=UPI00071C1B31|nr:hypothetical protein [Terracidiphilus gabretensis]